MKAPLGRLSVRIVWPSANVALPASMFRTASFQVNEPPLSAIVPPRLLDLVTRRLGPTTVTLLLQVLLFSSLSATLVPGSTLQVPPDRGLSKVPPAVAVTGTVTV